jgi:threonine dehydrogenase-like Zn-dependent dehydrogenase
MKIRATLLESIGNVSVVDRELELGNTDILVKTHLASVCLADVQMYRKGYYAEGSPLPLPLYLGHEGGGVVEEVGSRVHEFKPGDKVMLIHDVRAGGLGPGGMAEYFMTTHDNLIPVPEGLDMDIACLGETIAPFVYVVHRCGVKLGDTVVVTGLNFIGQIVAQGVKKSGAYKVIGIDNNDFRLNLAKELGTDVVINSDKEDALQAVMDLTGGKGVDLACQTAAYTDPTVEAYMALATEIVRPMGILAFQGDFLHPININLHRWHHESLDIRCIAFRHYTWKEIQVWTEDTLKPVLYDMIKIKPLITATYNLEDIKEAFKEASENPNSLKVVIDPSK